MALRVGDPAPDFELAGVDGRTGEELSFRRSSALGAPLVIAFYPADDSPVCTNQLLAYTRGLSAITDTGAALVAISPQSVESHRRFASAQGGFGFPLLADPDKEVGRAFGVLGLLDLYRRSTFVVDAAGRIAWSHRAVGPGLTFRPVRELAAAIRRADAPDGA